MIMLTVSELIIRLQALDPSGELPVQLQASIDDEDFWTGGLTDVELPDESETDIPVVLLTGSYAALRPTWDHE